MDASRRDFLRGGLLAAGGLLASQAVVATAQQEQQNMQMQMPMHGHEQAKSPKSAGLVAEPGAGILLVETPDIPHLPWTVENGVKVFHLVAEPVKQEFMPGSTFDLWGYNGSAPGPTIEVNQGDRVRLIVDNQLPEPTSMHWHGFEIPADMDGIPGIDQDPIPPGGRYIYEFTLHQAGTFFYHSHMAMQEMMGMIGLFIMHPKEPYRPRVDKDFGLIFQEYAILPNNTVPNSMSMEFNWLTINGKSGPNCTPLVVKLGERVRVRMVNLGMDHHPIHLHGNTFHITGTEAGRAPETTWQPENTVLLGVAQGRDIEFDAKYPGDWMLHCHLPHHMMNHMASMVGPMVTGGHGMPAGISMEDGMGMITKDPPLSVEHGPSLGRTVGIGADYEKATTNMPLHGPKANQSQQQNMEGMRHQPSRLVTGYPQDMFMPMDQEVAKPETYGLRPGWSGGVMGMSTLVRVLPPDLYDKIRELEEQAGRRNS